MIVQSHPILHQTPKIRRLSRSKPLVRVIKHTPLKRMKLFWNTKICVFFRISHPAPHECFCFITAYFQLNEILCAHPNESITPKVKNLGFLLKNSGKNPQKFIGLVLVKCLWGSERSSILETVQNSTWKRISGDNWPWKPLKCIWLRAPNVVHSLTR